MAMEDQLHVHTSGAMIAALTRIGLGYTIYAYIYTFNDDFSDSFFYES
jgi:hypothetical protein